MWNFLSGLRVRLILLVLLATLPALGITAYSGWRQYQHTQADAQETAMVLARNIASLQRNIIEETRGLLNTLTQLPQVQQRDQAPCETMLTNLLKISPRYTAFNAVDLNGVPFCGVPRTPAPITFADRAWFQQILKTKSFTISEYLVSKREGKPIMALAQPVFDQEGKFSSVVVASLDMRWLNQFIAAIKLPARSTVTILDRHGAVLVHYPSRMDMGRTGKALTNVPLVKAMMTRQEGSMEAPGLDGVVRIYGFTTLDPETTGIRIAVGLLSQEVFAEVRHFMRLGLGVLGLLTLLILALAWVGGDVVIIRKVNHLLSLTRRLSAGDLAARSHPPYQLGEIGQLTRAFDEMAETIQLRESEIKRNSAVQAGVNRIFREALTCESEAELGRICLAVAEELTGSRFGFINELNEAGLMDALALTDPGWKACSIEGAECPMPPKGCKVHGIYGRVILEEKTVIANDPPAHPHSIGLPEGHPPLTAFLGVPLRHGGRVMGLIGLGNKEGGYGQADQEAVEALAVAVVEALMRHRAEQALLKYKFIANTANDYMTLINRNYLYEAANAVFCQAHGKTREEVVGTSLANIWGEDRFKNYIKGDLDRCFTGQTVESVDWFEFGKMGRGCYHVFYTPYFNEDGTVTYVAVVSHDITERKRAEQALRESELQYRLLVATMPAVVFRGYMDSSMDVFDDKVENLTGYSQEEFNFRKLKWSDLILEEDLARAKAIFVQALETTKSYTREYRIRTKQGQVRWIECRGTIICDPKGEVKYIIGVMFDISRRKQDKEELEKSYALLQATLESTADGILAVDSQRQITGFNQKFVELWRISFPIIVGQDITQIRAFVAEQLTNPEAFLHKVEEVYAQPASVISEIIELKDGRAFEFYTQPQEIEGRTAGRVWGFRDISERQRAYEEIREAERFLANTFASIQDGLLVLDMEFNIIRVNPAMERWFAHAVPLAGKKCYQAFYDREESCEACPCREVMRTGNAADGLRKSYQIDGEPHWLELHSFPLKDLKTGETRGVIEYLREVTEARQAEEAFLASEARNRLLIEQAPIGICMVQNDSYVHVNPALVKMFGYEREEEITGFPVIKLVAPEAREKADRWIRELLAGKPTLPFLESAGVKKDGSTYEVTVWPRLIDYQGHPALLYFVLDVSEEMKLRARLLQTQKMEAIGTLAGGIAHDFNNILGVMQGYTEMALSEVAEDGRLKRELQQVLKAGRRAKDLVGQILAFSRPSQQARQIVRLGAIIQEDLKMLRATMPATIEVQQDLTTEDDVILADLSQMHQVLINLGTNAAQAMGEKGGVLEVTLSGVNLSELEATCYNITPGPYLKLSVRDTGPGMYNGAMARIFDPFFTTKEPGKGTGMGLAVIHSIIMAHGGAISVYSEPGVGSVFHVYLPRAEGESKPEIQEAQPITGGQERILLVEDEEDLATMWGETLQRLGYEVLVQTDSLEALEIFRTQPDWFDLVVTDQTMPKMSGVDLTRELLARRADLPIILCSGFSEAVSAENAGALGIREFLMKPVAIGDLAAAIRRALGKNES